MRLSRPDRIDSSAVGDSQLLHPRSHVASGGGNPDDHQYGRPAPCRSYRVEIDGGLSAHDPEISPIAKAPAWGGLPNDSAAVVRVEERNARRVSCTPPAG